MPNCDHQWDEIRNEGDHTKSELVNEMIRNVRRFETRGQGYDPEARRPLKQTEYCRVIQECRAKAMMSL